MNNIYSQILEFNFPRINVHSRLIEKIRLLVLAIISYYLHTFPGNPWESTFIAIENINFILLNDKLQLLPLQ